MAAVHGALVSDQQQHTVGIAVGQAGGGGVGILVQRIGILVIGILQLLSAGDSHLTDGIERVVQIDQGQIIRSNCHTQLAQRLGNTGLLIGGQVHVLLQILNRLSTIGDLPMPVIPQNLSENQPAIEDINEQKIFEEKGFAGYVEVYKYYLFNKNVLSEERKTELLNFINLHATMMKQTDPANLSEDQLREILNIGFSSIFEKKLPEILKATTCLSKDVLLNSGKQFLDYAYNVCVGRMVA